MRKYLKKIIALLVFLCIGFGLLVIFKAENADSKFSNSNYKIWAHAGYYEYSEFEKNSIEAFQNALSTGANGTELDVFYDVDLKDFIVSHDHPYNKKNGVLLRLDSVFNVIGNKAKYWLDFKNLKWLKPKEAGEARKLLGQLMESNHIHKQNVLLESMSITNLTSFTKNGFYTSWWINPSEGGIHSYIQKLKYKLYYFQEKFSSISMNYEHYNRVDASLSNIPINLFTINKEEELKEFNANPKIQIILSDKNYFRLNSENQIK